MNQTKNIVLHQTRDMMARVTYYPPNMTMGAHAHEIHQYSYLLAGGLIEETPWESDTRRTPSRGIKWAGQTHNNQYGPSGALILSIGLSPTLAEPLARQPRWRWEPMASHTESDAGAAPMLRLLYESPESERLDIIWDLIAHPFGEDDGAPNDACPLWLSRILEELNDAPEEIDFGLLAETYGIHRGHLSRAFKRRFGLSPSQYRSRAQVMRGVAHMMAGQRPAQAAFGAGFADQSHFTRIANRYLGMTPGLLGALLSPAG